MKKHDRLRFFVLRPDSFRWHRRRAPPLGGELRRATCPPCIDVPAITRTTEKSVPLGFCFALRRDEVRSACTCIDRPCQYIHHGREGIRHDVRPPGQQIPSADELPGELGAACAKHTCVQLRTNLRGTHKRKHTHTHTQTNTHTHTKTHNT